MWDKDVFGNNLRTLRRKKGLSQADLAEMIDGSINTISKWENGEIFPELGNLCRICNALGISPNDMLKND